MVVHRQMGTNGKNRDDPATLKFVAWEVSICARILQVLLSSFFPFSS
jgi:hypothetical protein